MLRRFFLYIILAVAVTTTSCTKESLEDCFSGLRLDFDFTLHKQGQNLFGDDVHQVRIYIFDDKGILRGIYNDSGSHLTNDYKVDLNVAPGKYKIVAWGGSNEDFFNSYKEVHMVDPTKNPPIYKDGVIIGETTLDDFRVMLNYNIAPDVPEDVTPVIDELDDLYYGMVGTRTPGTSKYVMEEVEVKLGAITEKHIELIKNTNLLKVTVTGINYLNGGAPTKANAQDVMNLWASGRNGRYKFNNEIGEYARMVRYKPHYDIVSTDKLEADIKVLRLDVSRHIAEPIYLYLEDKKTGERFPKEPIDVVNTLLQAKDPVTGEYIYKNQEDFDREYEHPIEVRIKSDLSVAIWIRGWEIVVLKPETGKRNS